MGYYFIIAGFELHHDATTSRALDEDDYDPSQTITFRIPIALPYQYDNADFMRVEGKFVHEGESYRLIKQKYAGDTLTIVCIKDEADWQIQQALADVASTYGDPSTDSHGPLKAQNLFIKEYLDATRALITGTSGWVTDLVPRVTTQFHEQIYLPLTGHPPEA